MADDRNPSSPEPSPGFQSEPPAPGPMADHVTATPSVLAAAPSPEETPFSTADFCKGLLRSALNVLIGAVVGAVAGCLVNLVLLWNNTGDFRLVVGAGLLLGVFFNRFIVHTLGLVPKKEIEARAAAAKSAGKAQADGPPPDSFREVIETVVFVVVLVLMLKSFDAEAFVIPTGSMSETLLGYQKMTVCPQCGYRFPVNCSQEVDPQDPQRDANGHIVNQEKITGCTCPNCREHITFVNPDKPITGPDEVADPPDYSGDRVLVAKFLYDLFDASPNRLDVVVFKFPGDNTFPVKGPYQGGVPMNYIKRLIGLSGETIAIHNGDLYVLPAPTRQEEEDVEQQLKLPTPDEKHEQMLLRKGRLAYYDLEREPDPVKREELSKQLWEKKHMHVQTDDADEAVKLFKSGAFQIIRKSPDTIKAMRRIVYDNDHPAKDLLAVQPPRWADRDGVGDGAWKADDAHGFRLTAPAADKVHWLGYRHILRGQDDKPRLITDFMGYNSWEGQYSRHGSPGENWVGDLILDCDVQADQAQGELTLELSRGVDRFRARWDLATGLCTLLRVQGEKEESLTPEPKPTSLKGGGAHHLRFANVDQRLTVWVDDALPFGDGVTYPPSETEGPTKENDLEPASIGLKGTGATVHGLKLWRDTYYTTANDGNPGASDVGRVDPGDPSTWSGMKKPPTKTIYVQPEHYLCMGDNSPESSDGRSWGLVPNRLLLGKALAVYYPFDRFGRIR
jgi:signal peptidase I